MAIQVDHLAVSKAKKGIAFGHSRFRMAQLSKEDRVKVIVGRGYITICAEDTPTCSRCGEMLKPVIETNVCTSCRAHISACRAIGD